MATSRAASRIALAAVFTNAAARYWFCVYPVIRRETRHWCRRAELIQDPNLRALALQAQRHKRGNVEGAAASATFAPRRHRCSVIRAQVAFQSIYDYVDTLAEQPNEDPLRNGYQLHRALLVALDSDARHPDYYAHYSTRGDNGYLKEIIDAYRLAMSALPSYAAIAAPARSLGRRIVSYQSRNLSEPQGGHDALAKWAHRETPPGTGLRWWETAASAGSSLGVLALIAAAARTQVQQSEVLAIENAYWPWVGALHSLLDSVHDEREDSEANQRSLLHYYVSPQETASRLKILAVEALRSTAALSQPRQHAMVLAGMTSFYLTGAEPTPTALLVARDVPETMGDLAKLAVLIFSARRTASHLAALVRRYRFVDLWSKSL